MIEFTNRQFFYGSAFREYSKGHDISSRGLSLVARAVHLERAINFGYKMRTISPTHNIGDASSYSFSYFLLRVRIGLLEAVSQPALHLRISFRLVLEVTLLLLSRTPGTASVVQSAGIPIRRHSSNRTGGVASSCLSACYSTRQDWN